MLSSDTPPPITDSQLFLWTGFLVGLVGTLVGVLVWLDGRRKDRIYRYLFQTAEKNIDKDLTEADLASRKSEVNMVSAQIAQLRQRIETEIPLEAKRAVLQDRIDANIRMLQQTLTSTLDLKEQLDAIGPKYELPPGLLAAVEAEILPEYIQNARHETLKTYLILVMSASALASVILPARPDLILQVPLLVVGATLLARLLGGYASRSRHSDPAIEKTIAAACFIGALTPVAIAFSRYPHLFADLRNLLDEQTGAAMVAMTLAICSFAGAAWALKRLRSLWLLVASVPAILGLGLTALSVLLVMNARGSEPGEVNEAIFVYGLGWVTLLLVAAGIFLSMRTWERDQPRTPSLTK